MGRHRSYTKTGTGIHSPRYDANKEHESAIHLWRLDRGLTVAKLAALAETTSSKISDLATGVVSPVYERNNGSHFVGELKDFALRIAEVLDVDVEDLYPRYVCKIRDANEELLPSQINDLTMSEYTRNRSVANDGEMLEGIDTFYTAMSSLKPREEFVLRCRIAGCSLDDLATELKVTRERVYQIEKQAMRKLLKKIHATAPPPSPR